MIEGPHDRGDEAQGAEYWRREADRLQAVIYGLEYRIEELTSPIQMVFGGVEDGVAYERSVVRIPESMWGDFADQFPHRKSWDWTTTGGLMYLLSPVVAAEVVATDSVRREQAYRDD